MRTQSGGSATITRQEALEQRRKQEAREHLQHAMSSHAQRAVNAYDVLIDAIAAFRRLKNLSTKHLAADDDGLIQRANALSMALKSRVAAKAEISEWKHLLKHRSNEEIVSMLHTIKADEINPTVVNMIKQTIDKRSASDDFAEMREVLLAAAERSDLFKRDWQNHFFMKANELEGKVAQQKQAQAHRQAQLEAERQRKECARAAAETERRRLQEEQEAYQQQRELAAIARAEQESRQLSKAQKKNARRRAKKSDTEQGQEDFAEVIERQRQEVDRHLAERDAEIAKRERERDAAERERLQEVLLREMQLEQQQHRQAAACRAVGGPSGWEGVDDYRAETVLEVVSTVKTHVRAGERSEARTVVGSSNSSKGKKAKKAKASTHASSQGQWNPNKQPSTPMREAHATKEPTVPQSSASGLSVWSGGRSDGSSALGQLDFESAVQRQQLEVERIKRREEQDRAREMAAALESARAELQQRDQELETFRRQQAVVRQDASFRPGSLHHTADNGSARMPYSSVEDSVTGTVVAADSGVVMAEAVTLSIGPAAPSLVAAPAEIQTVDDSCALTAEMLESDEGYEALSAFLAAQGMSKHKDKLVENEVSFDTLLMFNEEDYKELGIAKGPRVKMLRTCQAWYQEQLAKLQGP